MKKWTTRFTLSLRKVGTALHAACKEIPSDGFLHSMIQGILLAETSGVTPSEFVSVFGTSGATGAEGEKIGNSWLISDLTEAFCDQWPDDATALRDSRSRRTDSISAAMESYTLSEWEPIDEYYECEDEEEVDFAEWVFGEQNNREGQTSQAEYHTDHDETSVQELERQFGSWEDAETYLYELYSSASRTLDEARKLVNHVKQARGYSLSSE